MAQTKWQADAAKAVARKREAAACRAASGYITDPATPGFAVELTPFDANQPQYLGVKLVDAAGVPVWTCGAIRSVGGGLTLWVAWRCERPGEPDYKALVRRILTAAGEM